MIYVDELVDYTGITRLKYKRWCHLWTNGDIEELHKFAQSIGLQRRWFQDKTLAHYDLVPSKRRIALNKGAESITLQEYYRRKSANEKNIR